MTTRVEHRGALTSEQQAWLERRPEAALDPGQVICDAHHHLWVDVPGHPVWFRPPGDYRLADFRADAGQGHRVVRTVCVEAFTGYRTDGPEGIRSVGETATITAIAAESERTADRGAVVAGIVGFTDLRADGVAEALAAHVAAGDGRFRGVRYTVSHDPSPEIPSSHTKPFQGMLADPSFRAGVAAVGEAGLIFETGVYHPQIPELAALARALPAVPIVVDHLAGPLAAGPYRERRAEVMEEWRTAMTLLAACPNVSVKIGGIGNQFVGPQWRGHPMPPSSGEVAEVWRPLVRWCIEQFGVDRCMFESNFPVDRATMSYTVLWNSFKRIVADASPSEKAALFHDTAVRLFRLSPPEP